MLPRSVGQRLASAEHHADQLTILGAVVPVDLGHANQGAVVSVLQADAVDPLHAPQEEAQALTPEEELSALKAALGEELGAGARAAVMTKAAAIHRGRRKR